MKSLTLMLALLLATPSVQASVCDMNQGQESAKHAGMQHDQQDKPVHDCCDSDDEQRGRDCSDAMQCGNCSVSAPAINMTLEKASHWDQLYSCALSAGLLPPSHSSPPYRPPIA